ncbi:hypothetical protein E4U21_003609 [Claviceps maximensis]|nr:hypothetical protein E4U21_003609 [Claviceps maximensis]
MASNAQVFDSAVQQTHHTLRAIEMQRLVTMKYRPLMATSWACGAWRTAFVAASRLEMGREV